MKIWCLSVSLLIALVGVVPEISLCSRQDPYFGHPIGASDVTDMTALREAQKELGIKGR